MRTASRRFSRSALLQTDGVFRALTENRVQTPWIEALRKKQQEGQDAKGANGKAEAAADHGRDLEPKTMADSYHSVVWSFDTPVTCRRTTN